MSYQSYGPWRSDCDGWTAREGNACKHAGPSVRIVGLDGSFCRECAKQEEDARAPVVRAMTEAAITCEARRQHARTNRLNSRRAVDVAERYAAAMRADSDAQYAVSVALHDWGVVLAKLRNPTDERQG
jgi:hypothetical protein